MTALTHHHRHQLTHHKRTGNKDGRQHHAWPGEHDLQIMRVKPAAQRTVRAVKQQIHQTGHHRRDGERDIQQRQQQLAPRKGKTCHQPGQQGTEHQVHRYGNQRNHHRQPDGMQHVRVRQVFQHRHQSFAEGLDKDVEHRHHKDEGGDQHPDANQKPFSPVDTGRVVAFQLSNFRH